MFDRIRRLISRPGSASFTDVRKQIIAMAPISSGIAPVDTFFNQPRDRFDGLTEFVNGLRPIEEVTDPTLHALMALDDAGIGRARAIGLFWTARQKIGARSSPDNRAGAIERIAQGRGTWSRAELTAILGPHRDVIGLYDYSRLAEIICNSAKAQCAGDIASVLRPFLMSVEFERYPGASTLEAMEKLAPLAGIGLAEFPAMQEIATIDARIRARQVALPAACGPLMQCILSETTRYDGSSRAANPHGAFRAELSKQLEAASPEARAELLVDMGRCSLELRDRAWAMVDRNQLEGVNPYHIRSVTGSAVHDSKLETRKLAFSHEQALEYLRLMFRQTPPEKTYAKLHANLVRALVRAIEAPDAALAADLRNSRLPQKQADQLLAKLCPELAAAPKPRTKAPADELTLQRDRLRADMVRLAGLWVPVESGDNESWTDIDHQLFRFSPRSIATRTGSERPPSWARISRNIERRSGHCCSVEMRTFCGWKAVAPHRCRFRRSARGCLRERTSRSATSTGSAPSRRVSAMCSALMAGRS